MPTFVYHPPPQERLEREHRGHRLLLTRGDWGTGMENWTTFSASGRGMCRASCYGRTHGDLAAIMEAMIAWIDPLIDLGIIWRCNRFS